ncbi:MAG: hypothetical protein N3A38_12170, partial [Planctomycetota bacterium]|nr:hypothetical protein [Planctomycetota bacterium]
AAGAGVAPDEETVASRRLAQIKEVVESGQVSDVRPVLGVLDDLIRQYPTTKASVMAAIYRNQLAASAAPAGPAATGPERPAAQPDRQAQAAAPAPAGREAAETFAAVAGRADSLAAELRFGEAISALKDLPPPLRASPFIEEARKHIERLEKDAAAAYARMSLEAETAMLKGRHETAREIYAKISDRFGLQEYKEAADRRLAVMAKAEDERAAAEQKRRIEAAMARETKEFGNLLLSVATRARAFRYDECIRDLETFADGAGGGENAAMARTYAEAVKAERWLYNRARTRIREGKAPLQVFPKKGAPGQDIRDFNERGLVIGSEGAEGEIRWASIPEAQIFNLFKFALDVPSSEEHLALAVFAWHRNLKDDVANEIRAAVALDPKLKERADRLSASFAALSERLAAARTDAARPKE